MSASKDPRYVAAKRAYDKAHKALAGAHDFLMMTGGDDDYASDDADLLLSKMGKLLNAEFDAVTKAVGVGVYAPYGGRGWVRKY